MNQSVQWNVTRVLNIANVASEVFGAHILGEEDGGTWGCFLFQKDFAGGSIGRIFGRGKMNFHVSRAILLQEILLMEEILHHLGCIKPCK